MRRPVVKKKTKNKKKQKNLKFRNNPDHTGLSNHCRLRSDVTNNAASDWSLQCLPLVQDTSTGSKMQLLNSYRYSKELKGNVHKNTL